MDVSVIMSPTKSTLYNDKDEASEQLKSVLVQQSQQLKNLLMRTQVFLCTNPGYFVPHHESGNNVVSIDKLKIC